MSDYYAILGVPPTAAPEEIKRAYRLTAKAWHPDRFPDTDKVQAEAKLKAINGAYAVLSDPKKRAAYDTGLRGSELSLSEKILAHPDILAERVLKMLVALGRVLFKEPPRVEPRPRRRSRRKEGGR